ncbi:MAG: Chromosome segregation DNA-binding protein [Parcubacteria group bacterium GW2011_GWA2_52_8]|nr:MAG: Chromosome segregation DNA-binding protein [Parcubacteria group bacterium GW2011_GWA2_52_8]
MADDKFTLGHFEGFDDIDDVGRVAKSPTPSQGESVADTERLRNSVIIHPVDGGEQRARFTDGQGKPLLEIPLDQIVPNEFQPRRIFNEEKLNELAASIREHGIIQPLVVTKRPDGRFEIVVGERRFRASKIAGLTAVPAFVVPKMANEAKLEIALIENIQRADLNPIEEAKAFERLQKEFGLKLSEVALKVGKDISTVSNLQRLLNLPLEIQRALIEGLISEGQARPLLSLRDREEMLQMFAIIVRDQMKVRDIENKVREIRNRKIKVKEMFTPDPVLESLENLLRNKLGTRVQVNRGSKGGRITIEFYSDEELNDIIQKLG